MIIGYRLSAIPAVVFSGIDPLSGQQMIQSLKMADSDGFPLGLASLAISHNSHKPLRVLEFLLAARRGFSQPTIF
jgi:hypothetical protein